MEPEHPLCNQVVLRTIFKCLAFKLQDFRNYRLVSQAWWDATLKVWRDDVWVTLSNNVSQSEEEFFREINCVLSDSCQLVKYPLRKFELKEWNIVKIEDNTPNAIFWDRFGPLMTHLNIRRSQIHGLPPLRQIMFDKTPNLANLYLNENSYELDVAPNIAIPEGSGGIQPNMKYFQISSSKLPFTWMEVLLHFPNIQVFEPLQLGHYSIEEPNELTEMLKATEALRNIHGPHYLASLSELKLVGIGKDCDFPSVPRAWPSYFRQLQFPLKKLSLATWVKVPEYENEGLEKQIMEIHSSSLQLLIYDLDIRTREVSVDFPDVYFQNLTFLKLAGSIDPDMKVLMQCPNLKTLLLGSVGGALLNLHDGLNFYNFVHENLEEFSIRNDETFDRSEMEQLGRLMPNLKKVSLGLDNDLTFFEMGFIHGSEGLTEDSVRYGILSLDTLKEAHVRLSLVVGEKTFVEIKAKFPNSRISRANKNDA